MGFFLQFSSHPSADTVAHFLLSPLLKGDRHGHSHFGR